MSTLHLDADRGDIAPVVLMPGDPLRAAYIAETFLADVRECNQVRNMLGFTGTVRGHRVSVLGSGMGIPSLSIYAGELVREYGVTTLVRVGSCGAIQPHLALHDLVLATGAGTDSSVNRIRSGGYDLAAVPDFDLAMACRRRALELGIRLFAGPVFSTDLFYHPDRQLLGRLRALGVLALDMEAAGLYGIAAETRARALAVCTVSDHAVTGAALSLRDRERGFDPMIRLVLDVVAPPEA